MRGRLVVFLLMFLLMGREVAVSAEEGPQDAGGGSSTGGDSDDGMLQLPRVFDTTRLVNRYDSTCFSKISSDEF